MKNLLIAVTLVAFAASPALAQDSLLDRLAFGFGSSFGEESDTFSRDNLSYSVHLTGYDNIPLAQGAYTGLGLEVTFPAIGGPTYQFFNLNRTDVPGIPHLYGGMDFKFGTSTGTNAEGEEFRRYNWDYDERIVVGYELGALGPGSLNLEVYSLEENNPIRWAFVYDF